MLTIKNICISFDDHALFGGVDFSISKNEKIGLVGKNGSGKSTLLNIIRGEIQVDSGDVYTSGSVGFQPQVLDFHDDEVVGEFLMKNLEQWQGYRVDEALNEFEVEHLKERKMQTLSSGQKSKIYLANIYLQECDILLLDEPTNHLDVDGILWLECFIKDFDGAVIIVSHDRKLLNTVTAKIIELEKGGVTIYGGNYDFYKKQKEDIMAAQMRMHESDQKIKKKLEKEVRDLRQKADKEEAGKKRRKDGDKIGAYFLAEKAARKNYRQAKSLESRIARTDFTEKPEIDNEIKMIFKDFDFGPQKVAELSDVSVEIDGRLLYEGLNLAIQKGDRMQLSGKNGAGKTVLIKTLLGGVETKEGSVFLAENIKVGYLSQEHGELDIDLSPLKHISDKTKANSTFIFQVLACLQISREDIQKPLNILSKGQQSKVLLAEMMVSSANFLILDEPTNHLDLDTREALENLLKEYPGTILCVSHDRYFVEKIGLDKEIKL